MWFAMLGPMRIRLDDVELVVSAPKQRVLLAALLLAPGRPVSAAKLCELVWNGLPPRRSAVTLRSYVTRLRQALGPVAGARIVTAGRGYLIEVASDEVDVSWYSDLCQDGEAALRSGAWQRAADVLTQAQGLWRGEPLADIACQELQDALVPRLEQLRLVATRWRIEAELNLRHHASVVPELYSLTSAHRLEEPYHYQLMLALYRCGRRADALAAYQVARTTLIAEIGIEPGPELRRLHTQILADDGELAEPAQPDLTEQRLPPRQLPPPVPDFVGRAAELRELTALLDARPDRPGSPVLAVLSGEAGVGKTALAVHWAHQIAAGFPDGQLYLNLNGFGPAGPPLSQADAISRVLNALQIPLARLPADLEGQIGFYRTMLSGRRALILLDNAKDADQVRPLLPGSAGCLVLVTSRAPLTGLVAREGARALRLRVLARHEARQLVDLRIGPRQSAADRRAVALLIDACARLPLALAIATAVVAARPGQSLATVARDLTSADGRLDVLTTGDAATNLRAVLRWSYQALSAPAAGLFRLLAEHPGPDISGAAAASLAGLPPARAREALTELADLHLIGEHLPGRFAFHDLLRIYAGELLHAIDSEQDRRAASGRLLDHYLHSAHSAAAAISPTRDLITVTAPAAQVSVEQLAGRDQAIAWLTAEHQVLMRVIGYAADLGADTCAWQLPWALSDFLVRVGHWPDFAATQRTALAAAVRLGDATAQAYAHRYIGRAQYHLQDLDGAVEHLTRALMLRRELGEPAGEAGASIDLCRPHEARGDIEAALRAAEHGLRLYRSAGHRLGEAHALNSVGWYHALLGAYPQALAECGQALALCETLGYPMGQGLTWHSLGFIRARLGDHQSAIAGYLRALPICRDLTDRYTEAMVLADLGDAYQAAADRPAARRAWRAALAILDDLDHPDRDRLRPKLIAARGPDPGSASSPGSSTPAV